MSIYGRQYILKNVKDVVDNQEVLLIKDVLKQISCMPLIIIEGVGSGLVKAKWSLEVQLYSLKFEWYPVHPAIWFSNNYLKRKTK